MAFELISCVKLGYYDPEFDKELRLLCKFFSDHKEPKHLFGLKDLDTIDINKWMWKHYTLVDIRIWTDDFVIGMVGIDHVGDCIPLCKINPRHESMQLLTTEFNFAPQLVYFETLSKFDENEDLVREYYKSPAGQKALALERRAQKVEWSL